MPDVDRATLIAHLREGHPKIRIAGRSTKELSRLHATLHWRYSQNHHHGPSSGPNDRPEGWYNGRNATPNA
jgi:hypothetical protein